MPSSPAATAAAISAAVAQTHANAQLRKSSPSTATNSLHKKQSSQLSNSTKTKSQLFRKRSESMQLSPHQQSSAVAEKAVNTSLVQITPKKPDMATARHATAVTAAVTAAHNAHDNILQHAVATPTSQMQHVLAYELSPIAQPGSEISSPTSSILTPLNSSPLLSQSDAVLFSKYLLAQPQQSLIAPDADHAFATDIPMIATTLSDQEYQQQQQNLMMILEENNAAAAQGLAQLGSLPAGFLEGKASLSREERVLLISKFETAKSKLEKLFEQYRDEQVKRKIMQDDRNRLASMVLEMETKVISKLDTMESVVNKFRAKMEALRWRNKWLKDRMAQLFCNFKQDKKVVKKYFGKWRLHAAANHNHSHVRIGPSRHKGSISQIGNGSGIGSGSVAHTEAITSFVDDFESQKAYLYAKVFLMQLRVDMLQRRSEKPTSLRQLIHACETINQSTVQEVLESERARHRLQILCMQNELQHQQQQQQIEEETGVLTEVLETETEAGGEQEQVEQQPTFAAPEQLEERLVQDLVELDEALTRLSHCRRTQVQQQIILRKSIQTLRPDHVFSSDIQEVVEWEALEHMQSQIAEDANVIHTLRTIQDEQLQVIQHMHASKLEQSMQEQDKEMALAELQSCVEMLHTSLQDAHEELMKTKGRAPHLTTLEVRVEQLEHGLDVERAKYKQLHQEHEALQAQLDKTERINSEEIEGYQQALHEWKNLCMEKDIEIEQLNELLRVRQLSPRAAQLQELEELRMHQEQDTVPKNEQLVDILRRKEEMLKVAQKTLAHVRTEAEKWRKLASTYERIVIKVKPNKDSDQHMPSQKYLLRKQSIQSEFSAFGHTVPAHQRKPQQSKLPSAQSSPQPSSLQKPLTPRQAREEPAHTTSH